MRMSISSLGRRAVCDGTVRRGEARLFPRRQQAIDAGLDMILPNARQTIGEGEHDGDEEGAQAE